VSLALCSPAAIFLAASLLFFSYHLWLPFIPSKPVSTALPAGLGYRSVEEPASKNAMEASAANSWASSTLCLRRRSRRNLKNRDQVVLAGEERVATILFSDIRNFTATTAGVPSKEVQPG